MGVFEKIFGTRSQREIKKIQPTVDKILALEDEYRLLHGTKDIYCAVAEICGCKWTTVERSIRLVVKRILSDNAEGLIHMAGYPLSEAPTASDFVEILSHYIRKHGAVAVLEPK